MKQAKVPHVMVTPDQQLNLLRAKARTEIRFELGWIHRHQPTNG